MSISICHNWSQLFILLCNRWFGEDLFVVSMWERVAYLALISVWAVSGDMVSDLEWFLKKRFGRVKQSLCTVILSLEISLWLAAVTDGSYTHRHTYDVRRISTAVYLWIICLTGWISPHFSTLFNQEYDETEVNVPRERTAFHTVSQRLIYSRCMKGCN